MSAQEGPKGGFKFYEGIPYRDLGGTLAESKAPEQTPEEAAESQRKAEEILTSGGMLVRSNGRLYAIDTSQFKSSFSQRPLFDLGHTADAEKETTTMNPTEKEL